MARKHKDTVELELDLDTYEFLLDVCNKSGVSMDDVVATLLTVQIMKQQGD
jgi:hypothetical protein